MEYRAINFHESSPGSQTAFAKDHCPDERLPFKLVKALGELSGIAMPKQMRSSSSLTESAIEFREGRVDLSAGECSSSKRSRAQTTAQREAISCLSSLPHSQHGRFGGELTAEDNVLV